MQKVYTPTPIALCCSLNSRTNTAARGNKQLVRGFTLLELIIVTIIIGILVTLGVGHYGSVKEKTLEKEAQANLELIIAAEKIYKMEKGSYYNGTNTADLNSNLTLLLPAGSSANWNYTTQASNANTHCAQANRTTSAVTWRMRTNETEPVSGTCP